MAAGRSAACCRSGDGSVVVGYAQYSSGFAGPPSFEAFRYSGGVMTGLGDLLPHRRADAERFAALVDGRRVNGGLADHPDFAELARLGVASVVDGSPGVDSMRLRAPAGGEVAAVPPTIGYVIPRFAFDARLAAAARASGVDWVHATVRGMRRVEDGVPVAARLANVSITREGFMRNPTACGTRRFGGVVADEEGLCGLHP